MGLVRDYSGPNEIHMESGDLHEPTNTVPPFSPDLESALARVARQDCSRLKGTEFDIAMRRIVREGDTRFPLAADERKIGIGSTTKVVEY
ncbi:MAG: hypothetical protein M3066_14435 [Actinomycetota bacterium]|nr:hypothetical protein [Actinomycetota bacterium]